MTAQGLTAAELSRRSGVTYDVINKMKQRPESSTKAVNGMKLAAALGLEWDGQPQEGDADESSAVMVDVYNVRASAGHGAVVDDEQIIDRLSFPPNYLRTITKTHPRHLSIIGVQGDSMEPTLREDDVVLLDTTKTNLDYDGLFVLRFGDALHVKRVGRSSPGMVMLISDNKAIYAPYEISRSEVEVIGKVVWMGKRA